MAMRCLKSSSVHAKDNGLNHPTHVGMERGKNDVKLKMNMMMLMVVVVMMTMMMMMVSVMSFYQ
jgi:hypothetical protein